MNKPPIFCENLLDRSDHLRSQIETRRQAELNHQQYRYILIYQDQVLMVDGQWLLTEKQVPQPLISERLSVFLGVVLQDPLVNVGSSDVAEMARFLYFALGVDEGDCVGLELIGLRELMNSARVPSRFSGLFAQANSLINWHTSHGYCAACGTQSQVAHSGWRRDCPACERQHFPRTDPVVIMLVTYGQQCLLGRGRRFQENVYSCLAGFMEPGETIAQAALRELYEEAGVRGEYVGYIIDQPWPFPSSLMIGVHIEATSTAISIDTNELSEVRWVDKSEIEAVLKGATDRDFSLPPKIAIARNLLEWWIGFSVPVEYDLAPENRIPC